MLGLVAGVIWAFASSAMGWNQFTIDWIDPFGTIFIRLLKFIAVPLVLFSIIGGISNLKDITKLREMNGSLNDNEICYDTFFESLDLENCFIHCLWSYRGLSG